MELSVIESVTARRDYQQLVRARRRFSFTLTALMIATYYGFILLVALAACSPCRCTAARR